MKLTNDEIYNSENKLMPQQQFLRNMQSCHSWLNLLAALGGGNFFGSRAITNVKVARNATQK